MIFELILDLICLLILSFINITITILSAIHRSFQDLQTSEPSHQRLIRLQGVRLALVRQQETITRWLDEINQYIQRDLIQSPSLTNQPENLTSSTPRHTRVQTRQRRSAQSSTIGNPYPLPYTPPRTPEEVRRNNIIEWINDLHQQHKE